MERRRGRIMLERRALRTAVAGIAALVSLAAAPAGAQSSLGRAAAITIDGRAGDYFPVEAVFRGAALCPALPGRPPCPRDEEPADDSRAGNSRDVRQIHVTWDGQALFVAVEATCEGQALVVLLDTGAGGLTSLAALPAWRRAVRCAEVLRPDFLICARDRDARVELWRAVGETAAEQVPDDAFEGRASFDGNAAGRGLEVAIPWALLFPDAPLALDPEPGAPATPFFVLPPESSVNGLRLAALVVGPGDGDGASDVAPDPLAGVPDLPRDVVDVDRAVRVQWDAAGAAAAAHFVDFGAAIQTQTVSRFLPGSPGVARTALVLRGLRTRAAGRDSRLLIADAGLRLSFVFDVPAPVPPELYLTARVFSVRGEHIRDLYRDARRVPDGQGRFTDDAADQWDGRDKRGQAVNAGMYVLQLRAALSPGGTTVEDQFTIAVVR